MWKRDNDRREYFRAYNEGRPNLVIRLPSPEAKQALKLAAAGLPIQEFVVERLVVRLAEEALEDVNENVD